MTVYSISFNKADYAYSISYHTGNDDMTLDTNEEARNSLIFSKTALINAIRDYAAVSDIFDIKINTVRFGLGNKDSMISFTATTISKDIFPKKIINQSMKIAKIAKREKDVEKTRAKVLLMLDDLYSEVEKYLAGERAQQELPLEVTPLVSEETEEEIKDTEVSQEEDPNNKDMFGFDIFE